MSKKKLFLLVAAVAAASSFLTLWAIAAVLNLDSGKTISLAKFLALKVFVEQQYVEAVDDKKLMQGAATGLVEALGDKHSVYLDAARYKKLREHNAGTFGGIGVVMGFREKKVIVLSVMEGTPSEAVGLKQNDEIIAVDGTPVADLAPEEVAVHIRGEVGTKVKLTMRRSGEADWDVTIKRDNIRVKTAAGRMLDDGIGYIRIASFSDKTDEEFSACWENLAKENPKGLIIDLRSNPGGLLTACINIAGKVVPKGKIVSIVYRDGKSEEYNSQLKKPPCPIAVLIDENSASASEILAGALQDTKAAIIVGQKSYGKGSVQVVRPIPGGDDALKLTVAKYYTTSGRSIDGIGIIPDVDVPLEESGEDNQLLAAIKALKNRYSQNT